jgi:hypothetical protein
MPAIVLGGDGGAVIDKAAEQERRGFFARARPGR